MQLNFFSLFTVYISLPYATIEFNKLNTKLINKLHTDIF